MVIFYFYNISWCPRVLENVSGLIWSKAPIQIYLSLWLLTRSLVKQFFKLSPPDDTKNARNSFNSITFVLWSLQKNTVRPYIITIKIIIDNYNYINKNWKKQKIQWKIKNQREFEIFSCKDICFILSKLKYANRLVTIKCGS